MKKSTLLMIALSVVVITSVIIAGMVIYSATRPEKYSAPAKVTAPVSVLPVLPVTKPEEKIMELPMPIAEEAPKQETPQVEQDVSSGPVTQEEKVVGTSGASPEEVTMIGAPVAPPEPDNRVTAELPVFIPITNSTGPVPVTPTTPSASSTPSVPSTPSTPSADNADKNPQTTPQEIASFVPQESSTGPVAEGSSERKDLPPFTPSTSPTGPVKTEKEN